MRCIGGHSEQQIIRGENRFFWSIAPIKGAARPCQKFNMARRRRASVLAPPRLP
jgi:hypothetical protein